MTTALNVACHIVKKARKISALKLQQILYCVWREYGRQTGDILFWEPFSAKLSGPICQEVYDAFCFAGDETFIPVEAEPLDSHVALQINEILYKKRLLSKSEHDLELLVKVPGGAWERVWDDGRGRDARIPFTYIAFDRIELEVDWNGSKRRSQSPQKISRVEFMRRAGAGNMSLELIEWYGKTGDGIPERLRGVRKVVRKNSRFVVLRNTDGSELSLELFASALMQCDGKILTVYAPLQRDLTLEEQNVLEGWREREAKYYQDNPYGDAFWQMKSYFKNSPCPWMSGFEVIKGQRYLSHNNKVLDRHFKGPEILKYKVYFNETE